MLLLSHERGRIPTVLLVAVLLTLSSGLFPRLTRAQSLNIDFGDTPPAATYAAAGLAGAWNAVGVLPPSERQSLVGLGGAPSGARIYQIGGTSMLQYDDPTIGGDDAALLEDMFIGFNNPVDVCIWIENLANGDYEVTTYAMTPGDPNLLSRVRVDDGNPGPTMVGGSWPGSHVLGVTYARHVVTVTNGVIGLHSGLWGGEVQSGMNGIQLRALTGAGVEEPETSPSREGLFVYPNPSGFADTQVIDFMVSSDRQSHLDIFDAGGRLVRHLELAGVGPGRHRIVWDGRSDGGDRMPAGVYLLRILAGANPVSTKLLRLN